MNDDNNMPLHEQVYRIVVEGQEAEQRRANAWRPGTNFGRSSFAQYGALIGGVIAAFFQFVPKEFWNSSFTRLRAC